MQCVCVPNLKLFGSTKTELWAKELGEFSIILYGEIGWWAFLPTIMAAAVLMHRDFLNSEQL